MAIFNHLYNFLCAIIILATVSGDASGSHFSKPDSIKLARQDSIALKIYLTDPDSAILLARMTLNEAERLNYRYIEGYSYYVLSKANWAKANYRMSAEFGFKALKIFENSPFIKLWGVSLLGLGRTLIDLQNLDQASVFIERSLSLARIKNDEALLAEGFREKSMLLSEIKSYDSAMIYTDQALSIFEKLRDTISISILYGRKAKIYFLQKNYEQSNRYNKKSIFYDSLVGNRRALGISYYQAALDAMQVGKKDSAILFLKKSIAINQEIRNLSALVKAHSLLGDIYAEQNLKDPAVKELRIASRYKDSLYHTERNGQIQEMLSLYELGSKEKKIEQLAHDNLLKGEQVLNQKWFAGFLLVCVLLLALGVFFLSHYRKLQEQTNNQLELKNRAIEQQKEEIQSQAETLQQLNDLKSKLFSVISHDIRGPMATLHSLLDLLGRKKLSVEEFLSVADKLKNNLDMTKRTLENLLNWSLSQMEGIKTETRVISIKNTIDEACNLLGEVAQQKNVQIENDIDGSLLVKADSDQLQLILRNLIHNAIKFSNPYDNVFVSAYKGGNDICLVTVKDRGIGMSKAEIETVVNSTAHFSKTGTMQEKGTGLGLLLCKEFIKLNGGEIKIKSNINQGTEVAFTLPLAMN